MSANVLIVGGGNGSWEIRGKQIGAAIGARVTSAPSETDWRWADVCIVVKRALEQFAAAAYAFDVPVIWDALDFWQQPEQNGLFSEDAIALARRYMARYPVAQVIGATQAMADDLGGVYIPHHSRPRLVPAPVRARLDVVAYEGTRKYLGSWRVALETACARLGLTFVVNPPDLREVDLVVAFRGEQWDGPICWRWKSGVKCVNAMAAGRPLLTHQSAAFAEIQTPGLVVHNTYELESAIETYRSRESREAVAAECRRRATAFSVSAVARTYRAVIESAMSRAA